MLRFLFWNLRNNPAALPLAVSIASDRNIDIAMFAELPGTIAEAEQALREGSDPDYSHYAPANPRVHVFGRVPVSGVSELYDGNRLCVREVRIETSFPIMIVAVHLSSKFRIRKDQDLAALAYEEVVREIVRLEESLGHERTLVAGDFNMDPFEEGLVKTPGGFHAVMSREIARRQSRRVRGRDYPFFYNPMWNHFGDQGRNPPGTFYFQGSAPTEFFWHMLDQVLVRPALMDVFIEEELTILTEVRGQSLIHGASGRPDPNVASDHLPLLFALAV